ncbi:MAG: VanZ family protein [Luteolibacter sp.]
MPEGGPEIPHIDKVLHFGYFFGGGIILSTYVLLKKGVTASITIRFLIPLAVLASIGALDEYHQTFTPGRSGNDPFDWLADVLGAAAGIAISHPFHASLLKLSSRNLTFEEK